MGETVFFAEAISFKAKADALFAMVAARLQTILPCALVEHVGSTSLPDGLTKGDLDVQVRVRAAYFEEARALLASRPGHGRVPRREACLLARPRAENRGPVRGWTRLRRRAADA